MNNERNGEGIYTNIAGNKYESDWNDDFITKGICFYATGNKYEGDFQNNIPNGYDTIKYFNGDHYHEGNWKDGKKDGKCIGTTSNCHKYEGNWQNGMNKGQGICIYADGSKYDG